MLPVGSNVPEIDTLLAELGVRMDPPKIGVLNVLASWCGPCLAEMPHLQEFAEYPYGTLIARSSAQRLPQLLQQLIAPGKALVQQVEQIGGVRRIGATPP